MLFNLNITDTVLINFLLMIIWHLTVLLICMNLDASFFAPEKPCYAQKKWEKGGNFYVKKLKIKKWKDYLPQYVAKGGFSKRHFDSISSRSKKYITAFIAETCRAEWNHLMCCMYWVISFLVNSFYYAIIFSIIPIIVNIPFIAIQRYNRIRLEKINKKYALTGIVKTEKISI